MANGREPREVKEHAFKSIEKDIKGDRIGNPVLLYGKERYLIQWAAEQIVKKYVNEACVALDYNKLDQDIFSVDRLIENCETLTMFSEKRVVLVEDFIPLSGGRMDEFDESHEKRLMDYMEGLPDSCILIFTSEAVDKRKKLFKFLESHGSAYDFEALDEKQLKGFIAKRLRASGKVAKPSVIEELIVSTGYYHRETNYTLYNLENDLKKIIAHSRDSEILLSDILSTVAGNLELNIFAMLDAISRNRKDEAYRLLFNLVASGESVFVILANIASQFEAILEVKELRHEGKNLAQIQSILKIHEYRIKKAMGFGERYSVPELRNILKQTYGVDRNIKTGALEQNLALEMFISSI